MQAAAWWTALPQMGEMEESMLAHTAAERHETSRLACQIRLGEDLDGIVVEVPLTQY
jgi:2Fe-2S ferredoxin